MDLVRAEISVDVTHAMPVGETIEVTATVVAPAADALPPRPLVVLAIPGGTYDRRYWDMHPPGRSGYSKAEHLARRGVVFVACDYLGGGDSTRPADGDFIGLEVQADAAHAVFDHVKEAVAKGTLAEGLPPVDEATFVGIGQSLGGFITIIQQGKHADYPGIGVFGASPLLIAHTREQPDWDAMDPAERRAWIAAENARQSRVPELPMYHGAPRGEYRGIFHVPDVDEDLVAYDEAECHTVIPRWSGVDGMTPGFSKPFADAITTPVFLAFGEYDVSADPRREPTAYPSSDDITVVVFPRMAHMHNFAETRVQLWERFLAWTSILGGLTTSPPHGRSTVRPGDPP